MFAWLKNDLSVTSLRRGFDLRAQPFWVEFLEVGEKVAVWRLFYYLFEEFLPYLPLWVLVGRLVVFEKRPWSVDLGLLWRELFILAPIIFFGVSLVDYPVPPKKFNYGLLNEVLRVLFIDPWEFLFLALLAIFSRSYNVYSTALERRPLLNKDLSLDPLLALLPTGGTILFISAPFE
jgi:hypothetical protein